MLLDEERRARQDRFTRIMLYATLMYLVFFRSAEPLETPQERAEFEHRPTRPPPPPSRHFNVDSERERHWVELPPPRKVPPPSVRRPAPPSPAWPTGAAEDRDSLRQYAGVRRKLDAAGVAEVWQRAALMRSSGVCARQVRDVFSGACYDPMRICHDDELDSDTGDCYVRASLWASWAAGHRIADDLRLMMPMSRKCAVQFAATSEPQHQRPMPSCAASANETLPVRDLRGDIARSLAFLAVVYDKHALKLDASKRSRLLRWHVADPVDNDERWFNELVAVTQGDRNAFVDFPQLLMNIWGAGRALNGTTT